MAPTIRQLHEALDAGAAGWSAQYLVPERRLSVQRDYNGTPMITDIMPDEFYLALAHIGSPKPKGPRYPTGRHGRRYRDLRPRAA